MALLLLFLTISVKQDGTHLRAGCSPDETTLATLSSGVAVTVRYALSGESTACYKVSVESDGKTIDGYLSAAEIDGLEDFDQGRRDAARIDMRQVMRAVQAAAPAAGPPNAMAEQAMHLIDSGQPGRALQMLEPRMRGSKDPGLLAIAGMAAWKADDPRGALAYWRASLDLRPNAELESLVHRVEREATSDQSADKLAGMRVTLRYDSAAVNNATAREMLAALDDEYYRISQELGCFAEEKIIAIVQSQDAYRKTTNAAEWSGGQFDGRIRVPVLNGQIMDAGVRRVLAHETVHACLAMTGKWPSWLHEGLAQKLSGETLRPAVQQNIAGMIQAHKLPRLENIGQDWSRLDSAHAQVAYGLSLRAVELLYESQMPIGTLLKNPDRLAAVTADLDKRLGL